MPYSRDELIYLLSEAAELEHLLCCQYLFAAFSMKREVSEGLTLPQLQAVKEWQRTILLIARQEMEHLGLVCNLLTAIGGAPHFQRPNFPQSAKYYPQRMTLERFSERTLKRFICFERPDTITKEDAFCLEPLASDTPITQEMADTYDAPEYVPYKTVGELYAKIRQGIATYPLPDTQLFIGPADAQVGGDPLSLNFSRIGAKGGAFDVFLFPVSDRPSALKAVDLIVEQGEGSPSEKLPSHFQRFCEILQQLQRLQAEDPAFQPARPVVPNPRLQDAPETPSGTLITHPDTRAVLDLFNTAYETMLFLLIRFYAHTDETQAELNALKYAAFFPLMTMAVRPLSEMLSTMPAFEQDSHWRAGPSFESYHSLHLLPHKSSAWIFLVEQLQAIATEAQKLSNNPGIPKRMEVLARNFEVLAIQFQRGINALPSP